MTNQEVARFAERQRPGYAADLVRTGGLTEEEAAEKAANDYAMLADGPPPDHHLFTIEDEETGERVGDLWFGPTHGGRPGIAYLYDIAIDPDRRREGLGREAMRRFEETAAAMGFHRVLLHVFADNEPARSLYRSIGYIEESVWMGRVLGPAESGPGAPG